MSVFKRGEVWWFSSLFATKRFESTRQGNKWVAEQIEAARKTSLANGEVGIVDRKPVPTLAEFAELWFLPFIDKHKKDKAADHHLLPATHRPVAGLLPALDAKLDAIRPEDISAYIGTRQAATMEISTINRDLATLRLMFKLAMEWEQVSKLLPKVRLLPGGTRRERIVTAEEETAYLAAAAPLLAHFAILELDCGFRPEEAYRLKWSEVRWGSRRQHRDSHRQYQTLPAKHSGLSARSLNAEAAEGSFQR